MENTNYQDRLGINHGLHDCYAIGDDEAKEFLEPTRQTRQMFSKGRLRIICRDFEAEADY